MALTICLLPAQILFLSSNPAGATGNTIFTCDYNGGLKSRPIDGTGTQSTIGSLSACVELEASGSDIYIGYHQIRKIGTNGTGLTTLRTISDQYGLLINGGYIYYGYEYTRKIGRMNLDGTGANDSWIDYSATSSAPMSAQLAIAGNYIYFGGGENVSGKSIWKVPLTGGTPTSFVTDSDASAGIGGIDSDGTYIYWTDYRVGEIGRAAIDGSSTTDNWITSLSYPWGIQVADTYIYFNVGGYIGRVLLNGTSLVRNWVTNTSGQGLAIADAGVNSTLLAGDTTPPTLTSADAFSVAENSTSVGTITASESSTISINGGDDALKFQLSRSSDSSAAISFVSAPDFEVPTDVGNNNTYIVVIKAIDGASNTGYETVTVSVTDVADIGSFNSFSLSGGTLTAVYRTAIAISANIAVASKVTFTANGRKIVGCSKVSTNGTAPNIVAICNWKPSVKGAVALSATAYPINPSFTGSTSPRLFVGVVARTSR
jgi:hypothetical protein